MTTPMKPPREMTNCELTVEIAALLGGYTVLQYGDHFPTFRLMWRGAYLCEAPTESVAWAYLRWTTDIAAAYTLEDMLEGWQRESFATAVCEVVGSSDLRAIWPLVHATPRQRCEAFVALKREEADRGR